jgi:hypothetical protein
MYSPLSSSTISIVAGPPDDELLELDDCELSELLELEDETLLEDEELLPEELLPLDDELLDDVLLLEDESLELDDELLDEPSVTMNPGLTRQSSWPGGGSVGSQFP